MRTLLEKLKAAGEDKSTLAAKPVIVEETAKEQDVEEYRKRFVGDVECEEKDEPLLQETTARFVLFPIKYREVSIFRRVLDSQRSMLINQIWQMYKQAQAS